MDVTEAYRTVAKHIFVAYPTYSVQPPYIIILADDRGEAWTKARNYYQDRNVTLVSLLTTDIPNVYTI